MTTLLSVILLSLVPDVASEDFEAYSRQIPGTDVKFTMVPIRAGKFSIGSPRTEKRRGRDEGPQREVHVDAFWMATHEVVWEQYEQWAYSLEQRRREGDAGAREKLADAITRPTPAYTDMTFGMGREGYPAICMTQLAAKTYCKWLSAKTGEYYRLPTEAEWEYACRAGSTTAYGFGDDVKKLGEYAWYRKNSKGRYHKAGEKKPNSWGLYDMHGNVAEWCLDQHHDDAYKRLTDGVKNPLFPATELYPRVARGGGWKQGERDLRSAARMGSDEQWKMQDPQIPQSIWYHTDAMYVGFRLVRPLKEPSAEEKKKFE
ncbi:MAG: SUMF1/EgtB/PvdO family nonheme iron enzyme [Planctomycetota bacterium]|nr:SUMF1/EgtB/PvdO family nonheme iron enzyme [Planctomycetota bacterium]